MEKSTTEGESPVLHLQQLKYGVFSLSHVPWAWSANLVFVHHKLNLCSSPVVNKYQEGKVNRTLKRVLKVPELAGNKRMESVSFSRVVVSFSRVVLLQRNL